MQRFFAVLILILLTPLVAEVLGGSPVFSEPIALIFALPIYGGGVLFIRELVRRSHRGWPSILLLGAAFGVVEEGIALQSLFNPTLYGALNYGARLFGVNWVYTEALIIYHAVWTITIPILMIDLLFPEFRDMPFFGTFGLVVTAIIYAFGVVVLWLSTYAVLAPGYLAPPILLGLALLVVIVLGVVALGVLPKAKNGPMSQRNAPSPWLPFLASALGGTFYLVVLIPLGRAQGTSELNLLVMARMVSAFVVGVAVLWQIHQWSMAHNWSDVHRFALASGALVANTLAFGILNSPYHARTDVIGLTIVATLLLILLILFARRFQHKGVDTPTAGSAV